MIIPAMKKTYNTQVVLDIPEIEIPDGKCSVLLGHNGSGKSTLCKILAGMIPSDKGPVNIGLNIGFLPQSPYIFKLSVKNNVMQNYKGKDKAEGLEKAYDLLEKLGIKELSDKKAVNLSGGEKAKLALARLLMGKYDLLVLDEPTASMDVESVPKALKLIKEYSEKTGATVLLIIHGQEYIDMISDFCFTLNAGHLIR